MQLWRRSNEPLWEVVDRHFDEAEFLAECWRDALDEPGITLKDLAEGIEQRLLLHLDALALAGASMLERRCWPALADEGAEAPLALVAGLAVLASGEREDCWRLLSLLDESKVASERWVGITEALALSDRIGLQGWLCASLNANNEGPRVAGVANALARRQTQLGPRLTPMLQSRDPHVLRAAASLACNGDTNQLRLIAGLVQHPNPCVASAAIETALAHGLPEATESARYYAFQAANCELRARARWWLGVLGHDKDERRILALLAEPAQRREALWALGFFGSVAAVEAALPFLADDDLGPLAAEVVTAITGLPTDSEELWLNRSRDDDEPPALTDEQLDVPLGLTPEDLLPIPNPDAVSAWWSQRSQKFDRNERWMYGEMLHDDVLARGLLQQPLRRRHGLSLLAQVRTRAATRFPTRQWAHIQLRALRRP